MLNFMLKALFYALSYLPPSISARLARGIGKLLYRYPNRERHVAAVNLQLCFPGLSKSQQQTYLQETLIENAKTLLEMPYFFRRGGYFMRAQVTQTEGIAHYEAAIASQKGVILLAPHLGNWEVTVHYLNQFAPITALYDPPKQAFLADIILNSRQSTGATLCPADKQGIRRQLNALKNGGVIGILPDQVPNSGGVYAPFMGHEALTMTLVQQLAKRSGAVVLMTFAKRLPDGHFALYVLPAEAAITADDASHAAAAMNKSIEACIAHAPCQYQWTYKRFKKLKDGKQEPYQTLSSDI